MRTQQDAPPPPPPAKTSLGSALTFAMNHAKIVVGISVVLGLLAKCAQYRMLHVPLRLIRAQNVMEAGAALVGFLSALGAVFAVPAVALVALVLTVKFLVAWVNLREFSFADHAREAVRVLAPIGGWSLAAMVPFLVASYPHMRDIGGWPLEVSLRGQATALSEQAAPKWECRNAGHGVTCNGVYLVDRDDAQMLLLDRELHWRVVPTSEVHIGGSE